MATAVSHLTAEQFATLPDGHNPIELVRGRLIELHHSMPRHGEICSHVCFILRRYLDQHPQGRVVISNSSIILERDPDTVRGADVAYYSYQSVPKGPLPAGFLPVAPELVFEVLSPNDRWSAMHAKIADYLTAGVQAVCVLDDSTRTLQAFYSDRPLHIYSAHDEFTLPEVLSGFRVSIGSFFE